jgi:hypothetical protein
VEDLLEIFDLSSARMRCDYHHQRHHQEDRAEALASRGGEPATSASPSTASEFHDEVRDQKAFRKSAENILMLRCSLRKT